MGGQGQCGKMEQPWCASRDLIERAMRALHFDLALRLQGQWELVKGLGPNQIPAVAKDIAEDGNRAIGFYARGFFEFHACCIQSRMIAIKVVRVQKQPDPPGTLIADGRALGAVARLREDKSGAAPLRRYADPAFVALVDVLSQDETHDTAVNAIAAS